MKRTNYFFHMLIALGLCAMMYCGDGGEASKDEQVNDSTATHDHQNNDSVSAAHQRDPSTAYPQPPVTGSNQDSSRVKDTINRPGY